MAEPYRIMICDKPFRMAKKRKRISSRINAVGNCGATIFEKDLAVMTPKMLSTITDIQRIHPACL
jgi:hypothetical protein